MNMILTARIHLKAHSALLFSLSLNRPGLCAAARHDLRSIMGSPYPLDN